MRHPVRLARQMGFKAFLVFQLFLGAGTLCLLINPLYWGLTLVWFTTHYAGIEDIFPRSVLYLGMLGLFVGNAVFIVAAFAGCFERRNYADVKWALLMPAYWVLMSIAAWKGLLQLFYKPSYWEKTEHGFFAYEEPDEIATAGPAPTALAGPAAATGTD